MPRVFEISDRIHTLRPGRRHAAIRPEDRSLPDEAAITTGANKPPPEPAMPVGAEPGARPGAHTGAAAAH